MGLLKQPSLEDQIKKLRADIDAKIDELTEVERKRLGYTLPPAMIRANIIAGIGCQCAAYLRIKEKADEEAARSKVA
jgi:hypothetical protein